MSENKQETLIADAIETPELACWLIDFKPTFFEPSTFSRLDDKTVSTWARLVVIAASHGQRVRKFQVISGAFVVPDSILDENDHKGIKILVQYGMITATRKSMKLARPKEEEVKSTENAAKEVEVGLEEFEAFWKLYPARGKHKPFKTETKRWFLRTITTKELYSQLLTAVSNYAASGRVLSGYVRDAPNWTADDHWKSWIDGTLDTPQGREAQHGYQNKVVL